MLINGLHYEQLKPKFLRQKAGVSFFLRDIKIDAHYFNKLNYPLTFTKYSGCGQRIHLDFKNAYKLIHFIRECQKANVSLLRMSSAASSFVVLRGTQNENINLDNLGHAVDTIMAVAEWDKESNCTVKLMFNWGRDCIFNEFVWDMVTLSKDEIAFLLEHLPSEDHYEQIASELDVLDKPTFNRELLERDRLSRSDEVSSYKTNNAYL